MSFMRTERSASLSPGSTFRPEAPMERPATFARPVGLEAPSRGLGSHTFTPVTTPPLPSQRQATFASPVGLQTPPRVFEPPTPSQVAPQRPTTFSRPVGLEPPTPPQIASHRPATYTRPIGLEPTRPFVMAPQPSVVFLTPPQPSYRPVVITPTAPPPPVFVSAPLATTEVVVTPEPRRYSILSTWTPIVILALAVLGIAITAEILAPTAGIAVAAIGLPLVLLCILVKVIADRNLRS